MKKGSWLIVGSLWLAVILIFTGLCGCQNRELYKDGRIIMGTFVKVTSPEKKAAGIVFREIKRVENLLSKYKEDSEVAKLNRLGKLKVSKETFYVIKKAKEFWQLTDGAFDITVAPLMDIWGFADKEYVIPGRKQLKKTLALVGSDKIILHDEDNLVEFKTPGMKIDLGAIAKGYAVDLAVKNLKADGITSCVISIGGQVYCLGTKSGKPWSVAIRNPDNDGFAGYVGLTDKAISTAGNYEQYFTRGNKRYGHIFNPRTGYPAESGITSVTVIASDGLTADALATAIFILGKEKGMSLLKNFPGVEAKIIERKDR
ncbi:MAG: FAD:protein FMN transferase [Candidatus Omnitrophota bacterium]|jgi:thiamine biosynthesis lipoprotein